LPDGDRDYGSGVPARVRNISQKSKARFKLLGRVLDSCIAFFRLCRVAGARLRCFAEKTSVRNRSFLTILLCGTAVPIVSAQLPDMPRPRLPLADKILLGTIAAGRAGDAFTTHQFLMAGQDEASLPTWIACRQPNMWTYSTAISIGQIQLTRLLIRRNHLRMARSFEVIHAVFIWDTVAHNEQIIAGRLSRRLSHTRPNSCLNSEGQVF
jgi:hypothetical protein